MAYRLRAEESVRAGLRRSAAEQLDDAVRQLREHLAEDPVDAVHSARKAVKKERSLLRLARGALPPQQRRRENDVLRAAARALSAARDADVMIATVDDLAQRYAGQLPESAFDAVRDALRRRVGSPDAGGTVSDHAVRALAELGAVRGRVDEWPLARGGFRALEEGIRRTYADGRAAFAQARTSGSDDDWHTWRKRVKDLWYQQRLLADVLGPVVKGHAEDAHRLADLLGDDHDLAVLRAAVTEGRLDAAADLDALIDLIGHRRRELQTDAVWLGRRVYAESSAAYLRRMRRSWRAARGQQRAGSRAARIHHEQRSRYAS